MADIPNLADEFEKNTRRHPRVAPTKVMVRIPSVERFREAYLRDLSEGGLYVKTERLLPVGTDVEVELWPPDATAALLLPATVVRHGLPSEPAGVGMKLGELAPATATKLRSLIESFRAGAGSEGEVGGIREQAQGLVAELERARGQVAKLTGEADRAAARIRELEQYEADVRRVTERLAQEKGLLEQNLKEEGRMRESLALKLAATERDRDQAETASLTADTALASARQELGATRVSLEAQAQKLATAERDRDQATTAHGSSTAMLGRVREDLASLQAKLAGTERDRDRASESRQVSEAALQGARHELTAAQKTVDALREELEASIVERDALKAELDEELTAAHKLSATHESKIAELQADIERQRSVERDLRRLLSALGSEGKEKPVTAGPPAATPPASSEAPPKPEAPALSSDSWEASIEDVVVTEGE